MNEEYISSYTDKEIKKIKVTDQETKRFLEKIKQGYYKILSPNEGIDMKNGVYHIIHGGGHRLTDKGLHYFELIIKEYKITHYIRYLFENEKWTELKEFIKGKID